MEVKVVTGANLGDEGKGLVSYCLAKKKPQKRVIRFSPSSLTAVLSVHIAGGKIFHCTGTGALVVPDTFYHERFVLDPMTLWLTGDSVIIDPDCRVVLPCDVMRNREKEIARGENKHGSCGMGIFEAVKRSANEEDAVYAGELLFPIVCMKRFAALWRSILVLRMICIILTIGCGSGRLCD